MRIGVNYDWYTEMTLAPSDPRFFQSFAGALDGRGQAVARPTMIGSIAVWRRGPLTFWHAALAYDAQTGELLATNPIPVTVHRWLR